MSMYAKIRLAGFITKAKGLPSPFVLGIIEKETEKAIRFSGSVLIQPSDHCFRCGKEISHPASKSIGYGPECSAKLGMLWGEVESGKVDKEKVWSKFYITEWLPKSACEIKEVDFQELKGQGVYITMPKEEKSHHEPKKGIEKGFECYVNDKDDIEVKFPYDPDMVKLIKSVVGARWNKANKSWQFAGLPEVANEIDELDILDVYTRKYDEKFQDLLNRYRGIEKAQALKFDDDLEQPPVRKFDSWNHQRQAYHYIMARDSALLYMGMGPQPYDAKLMTPVGEYVTMGDVKVGDYVVGQNGKPTQVTAITEKGYQPVYKVTFSDGASTQCCENHLWTVQTPKMKNRNNDKFKTVPLKYIIDKGLKTNSGWWKWFVPMCNQVEFDNQVYKVTVPAYLLGVLLGDGGLTQGVGLSISSHVVKEIVEGFLRVYYKGVTLKQYSKWTYGLTSERGNINPLLEDLKHLGLIGKKSIDKFIPKQYKYGSAFTRQEVLRGLFDTDGSCGANYIEYSTSSLRLAKDVQFMVQSLGGTAKMAVKKTTHHDSYRLHVKMPKDICPFYDGDKFYNYLFDNANPTRSIRKIEYIKHDYVRCITVDNDDGLYLTDDFIVTHNTGKTKVTVDVVMNRGHKRVLIVCPKSVLEVWREEFEKHTTDHNTWHLFNGTKGTVKKRCEDALRNLELAEKRNQVGIFVCNYDVVWREDFESFMTKANFDLIVADESQKIKSHSAKASKALYDYGKNMRYKLALTGTPMPNSPMDIFGQMRFLNEGIFGRYITKFKARYFKIGYFNEVVGVNEDLIEEMNKKIYSITYRADRSVLELPKEMHTYRYAELTGKTLKAYKEMKNHLVVQVEKGELTATNVLSQLLRLQQIASGYVSIENEFGEREMVQVGTEKLDAYTDVIEEIEKDEPVVTFCRFVHDIDNCKSALEKQGRKPAELSGRLNQLAEFKRGEFDSIVVQIQAGGVGVDLTRARYCIYYSMGYSLGDYEQSLARISRPGQEADNVVYTHIIAKGTVDEKIYKALESKKDVVKAIIDEGDF